MNAGAQEFVPSNGGGSGSNSSSSGGGGSGSGQGSLSGSGAGSRKVNPPSPSPQPSFSRNNNTSGRVAGLGNGGRRQSQRERKAAMNRGGRPDVDDDFDEMDLLAQQELLIGGGRSTPNKRGQINVNHLVNFNFPPRQRQQVSSAPVRRRGNYQPFNKERFINANYRFLVKSTGDYTPHLFDPDLPVDWKDIVQILIPTSKEVTCPVCLSPPVAAKITRCGHFVYGKDVKSAVMMKVDGLNGAGGDLIEMRLMKRGVHSCVALPRESHNTWTRNNSPVNGTTTTSTSTRTLPPITTDPSANRFAKLLIAPATYIRTQILEREKKELGIALNEAQHEEALVKAMGGAKVASSLSSQVAMMVAGVSERPFVEMALKEVKSEIEGLSALEKLEAVAGVAGVVAEGSGKGRNVPGASTEKMQVWDLGGKSGRGKLNIDTETIVDGFGFEKSGKTSPVDVVVFTPEGEVLTRPGSSTGTSTAVEKGKGKKGSGSGQQQSKNDGHYYFYQAGDGQHVYLHPLDVKILKHEFEDYDKFPDELRVRTISVQESTMDEDLRKKCRYLSHLPLSCDVNFCEVDLTDIVSKETLDTFKKEINDRKARQEAKHRREEEERQRSQVKLALSSSPDGLSWGVTTSTYRPSSSEYDNQRREVTSSWEDPALFDTMFPAANTNAASSSSGNIAQAGLSGSEDDVAPSGSGRYVKETNGAGFSFAKVAANSAGKPVPVQIRRTVARHNGGGSREFYDSDDEGGFGGVDGWALDLEEAMLAELDGDGFAVGGGPNGGGGGGGGGSPAGGGKNGKKAGKGGKKVLLVTNGGKRGGRY
ncbi:hypothetical protein HDU76_010461 [Blyttiomyces sp. JEL0837]|nr:hypothetical protein HDU76_010461 [Blyttiomyces sp. JEL0837]